MPAGLNEKAGSAFTDFCLACGMDPRRAAGYCIDMGRGLVGDESFEIVSGPRIGNEKSGLGTISKVPGPALPASPADCDCVAWWRGSAISAMVKTLWD